MKIKLDKLDIFSIDSNKNQKENNDFYIDNYLNFPVLLNNDGSVWKHGTLFLLNKIKSYQPIDSKRLNDLAIDIRQFREWTIEEDIDYINVKRRLLAPTYLFKKHLTDILLKKITNDNIKITSPNTLKRKMGSILAFYRYLKDVENIVFKFPMWENEIINISYQDRQGFIQYKQVSATDLTKKVAQSTPSKHANNVIIDGRKLHPLNVQEQIYLFKALNDIGHTEMQLAFLIAIATGARTQTVFTLRQKHFEKPTNDYDKEIPIKVGAGTSCDTKYDKIYKLIFPKFVYEKIKIYLNSPRYKKRLDKAKCIYEDNNMQYIFLSTHGNPFYISKYDPYKGLFSKQPDGDAVRMFIKNRLKVKLKELRYKIRPFSFHDLRATYGMNQVDILQELVNRNELSYSQMLHQIRERMGHSSAKTTEQYLDFRKNHKIREVAQDEYESYLEGLIDEK